MIWKAVKYFSNTSLNHYVSFIFTFNKILWFSFAHFFHKTETSTWQEKSVIRMVFLFFFKKPQFSFCDRRKPVKVSAQTSAENRNTEGKHLRKETVLFFSSFWLGNRWFDVFLNSGYLYLVMKTFLSSSKYDWLLLSYQKV